MFNIEENYKLNLQSSSKNGERFHRNSKALVMIFIENVRMAEQSFLLNNNIKSYFYKRKNSISFNVACLQYCI